MLNNLYLLFGKFKIKSDIRYYVFSFSEKKISKKQVIIRYYSNSISKPFFLIKNTIITLSNIQYRFHLFRHRTT